jgi:hypothetical protein
MELSFSWSEYRKLLFRTADWVRIVQKEKTTHWTLVSQEENTRRAAVVNASHKSPAALEP